MGVDRADHVPAAVEIEQRAARVRTRRAHPFGVDATRADGLALDIGIDGERPRDLLEARARLLHGGVRLDHWLSPEHLNDLLKLLLRHAVTSLIDDDRLENPRSDAPSTLQCAPALRPPQRSRETPPPSRGG